MTVSEAKRLLPEQMLDMAAMKELLSQNTKMVTPAVKREAVAHLKALFGLSEQQALSKQSGGLFVAQRGRARLPAQTARWPATGSVAQIP